MLYEVITQELRRGAYYSNGRIILQPEDRIDAAVGDDVTVRAFRITSYNVCYTKLLRSAMASALHANGFDASAS